MRWTSLKILLVSLGMLALGDTPNGLIVLAPLPADSISYDQGTLLIVSAPKDAGSDLLLSTQWESEKLIDISTKAAKENFPKDFYRLFAPQTTLELLSYSFKHFKGYTKPDSLLFAYNDTVSIQGLWRKPEFAEFVKKIQTNDASDVLLYLRGWKDTVYSTAYDDPNNDSRTLRKFNVQLIPEANSVYCSPVSQRSKAIAYVTRFIAESKPTSERTVLFHNSTLEQSCNSCHDGLPSADGGNTMKADCNICHKAFVEATFIHAPVEMKECGSCHTWSADKHAVVVEKAVPGVCYDCHDEKQAQVDSSQFPHPVAGDCLTCHSPHGTEQKHLLKKPVYDLCTTCHEEQKSNHPVGRHPVRFVALKNGEEIACTSCHNPHGSQYEKLKRFPGGRMDICTQCH